MNDTYLWLIIILGGLALGGSIIAILHKTMIPKLPPPESREEYYEKYIEPDYARLKNRDNKE